MVNLESVKLERKAIKLNKGEFVRHWGQVLIYCLDDSWKLGKSDDSH